jgi:hypothetical protein
VKGSEKSTKFAHLKAEQQHKRGVRDLIKRCLIVCEDDVSAVAYFEAIKKLFHVTALSVKVAGSKGYSQPIQVVKRAIDEREKAFKDDVQFDYIWCVIDGDYPDKVKVARERAKSCGVNGSSIQLIVTTQCFEHWILLHFAHDDSPCESCDCVVSRLRKHVEYQKGSCDFHLVLAGLDDACRRAKSKDQVRISSLNILPEDCNPCSEIYKIIEILRSIARK